jgi:ribosome maturation protein Sdo1
MTSTLARIKKAGKNFEIIVDLDDALKFKKGEASFIEAEGDKVFTDSEKFKQHKNIEVLNKNKNSNKLLIFYLEMLLILKQKILILLKE